MKCENLYCIYEQNGKCILDEIEINSVGMCSECILLPIPIDAADKMKSVKREEFEKLDKEM